jgi:gliding motility-associated-like protein
MFFIFRYIWLHLFFIMNINFELFSMKPFCCYLITLVSFFVFNHSFAQLTVNAGVDKTVCIGASTTIGGTPAASGGVPPYTYSWSPTLFLSNPSISNPTCTPASYATYTLTVTDASGVIASDVVVATPNYLENVNAGPDVNVCIGGSALLGADLNVGGLGVTYVWAPSLNLDNSSLPRPTCTPTATTTYTLTSSIVGCASQQSTMTVNYIPTPLIEAGPDITIQEGEVALPIASGGFYYAWNSPGFNYTITYPYSYNPNFEPILTTTYYLYGTDVTNTCPGYDSMTVYVVANEAPVFYNTFSPNRDGNNDTWYIGNISKYPDNKLEIYNRNGKLVYKASNYINNWDGKAFGEDLPAATYYYTMDLGNGKGIKHGTVTIIR